MCQDFIFQLNVKYDHNLVHMLEFTVCQMFLLHSSQDNIALTMIKLPYGDNPIPTIELISINFPDCRMLSFCQI